MPIPVNYQAVPTGLLLEAFKTAASEIGVLTTSDAPHEELTNAESTVNQIEEEIMRRMSW